MSLNFSETWLRLYGEHFVFRFQSSELQQFHNETIQLFHILLNHLGVAVRVDICLLVGEYLLARSLNQGEGGAKLVGDVGEEA